MSKAKSIVFMTFLFMTFISMLSLIISSNLPFNMILFIITLSIFGSMEISSSSSIYWLPMITIMLFVGGLMIIYIFIMSMNSEVTIKEKYSLMMIIPIILSFYIFSKKTSLNAKMKGSSMFSLSWWYILIMMLIILTTMMMMSKIILSPLKPSKKLK